MVVAFCVALFGMTGWWTLMGKISEGDGFMLFAGCLLAAIVFSFRGSDPAWLEPVSIIKR
jgi:hypothetical protein